MFGHSRHVHYATDLNDLVAIPKIEELVSAGCSIINVHVERADHKAVGLSCSLVHDTRLSKVDKHYGAFKDVIVFFKELMLYFNFRDVLNGDIQSVVFFIF